VAREPKKRVSTVQREKKGKEMPKERLRTFFYNFLGDASAGGGSRKPGSRCLLLE